MRRRTTAVTLLFATIAALTCDAGPDLLEPQPCPNEQVTVTVTPEGPVDFSWSPACPMAWLEVFELNAVVPAWIVSGRGANVMQPVVRYGRVPDGGLELLEARSLRAGVRYEVRVLRWLGDEGGPGSIFPAGSAEFER